MPLPSDLVKLTEVVRTKSVEILKEETDRDVMAEIFRCLSDTLLKLGPGILGTDDREMSEIIAITLLVLERDHPCMNDDEENRPPDDDERAEIEIILIDAAVDVVVALAKTLKDNFVPDFEPFYRQFVKFTVLSPRSNVFLIFCRVARTVRNDRSVLQALEKSLMLLAEELRNVFRNYT